MDGVPSSFSPFTARPAPAAAARPFRRRAAVGVIGFLTLVDLFAAQAILPALTGVYRSAPAAMGFAVNASTIGMAAAGLAAAVVSGGLNRRLAIGASLGLLSLPTALLAFAPDLASFMILRIVQGIFMVSAFTLTIAYLAEQFDGDETAGALAAYVTGIVASNLVGRFAAAFLASRHGLAATFFVFAGLNIAGAVLVFSTFNRVDPAMTSPCGSRASPWQAWRAHLASGPLRAAFGIGFCILFAFIGIFTYVTFVLAREPLVQGLMQPGAVYAVFLPSLVTTPLAGLAVRRFGTRASLAAALALAGAGLPLLLRPDLVGVLAGMTLAAAGTFFAQAAATAFVGRAAARDHAAASGLYLASYYTGGIAGAAVLGPVFETWGWGACVAGVGLALAAAAGLAVLLETPVPSSARRPLLRRSPLSRGSAGSAARPRTWQAP